MEEGSEEGACAVQPMFIDRDVLTLDAECRLRMRRPKGRPYLVNGSTFYANEATGDELAHFEVFAARLSNIPSECEETFSTTPDSDCVYYDPIFPDKALTMDIQTFSHGIVINSDVYLTSNQWNTIVAVDSELMRCVACELSPVDGANHVLDDGHRKLIEETKPLARFSLSIVRKIRDEFHCAVCNVAFAQADEILHFSSVSHNESLLSAINKVSDLNLSPTYNTRDRNATYHFNAMALNARKYRNNDNGNFGNRFNDNSDVSSNENTDNDVDDDSEIESIWGESLRGNNVSYASILKKKIPDVPVYVEIEIGNKRVTVKFDSYHMVIKPEPNRIYCMVCEAFSHFRSKAEHCSDISHLEKLAKCRVVDAYGNFYIRVVNTKFYHCGHCNNLVLITDLEDHLETRHSRTYHGDALHYARNARTNVRNDSDVSSCVSGDKPFGDGEVGDSDDENTNNDRQENANNDAAQNVPSGNSNSDNEFPCYKENNNNDIVRHIVVDNGPNTLLDMITLELFGYKITISALSLNVIMSRHQFRDYYCDLCDTLCPADVILSHLSSIPHIQTLQRTPFIPQFSCNLVRAIRDKLHCAICNLPIAVNYIYSHVQDFIHLNLLQKSLGVNAGFPIPPRVNTGPCPVQNNVQNPLIQHPPTPAVNNIIPINKIPINNGTIPPSENLRQKIASSNGMPLKNARLHIPEMGLQEQAASSKVMPVYRPGVPVPKQEVAASEPRPGRPILKKEIPSSNVNPDFPKKKIPVGTVTKDASVCSLKALPKKELQKKQDDSPEREIPSTSQEIRSTIREIPLTKKEIEVTKQVNEEDELNLLLNDSVDSVDLDLEDFVFVKLKHSYFKVSVTSFNTLVHIGDGSRYCFLCSIRVKVEELKRHVETRSHTDNLKNSKFVDKFAGTLLRQAFLMFHCSVCNVVVSRRELKNHLSWPAHTQETAATLAVPKKARKKSGKTVHMAAVAKEAIYSNEKEPEVEVLFKVRQSQQMRGPFVKKKKMVFLKGDVLKVDFDSWNGVSETKEGWKCCLCQVPFEGDDLGEHVQGEGHKRSLQKSVKEGFKQHLLRQINDATLHCMICNAEVLDREHLVTEHIEGKRHRNNLDHIRANSSKTKDYFDCENEPLQL